MEAHPSGAGIETGALVREAKDNLKNDMGKGGSEGKTTAAADAAGRPPQRLVGSPARRARRLLPPLPAGRRPRLPPLSSGRNRSSKAEDCVSQIRSVRTTNDAAVDKVAGASPEDQAAAPSSSRGKKSTGIKKIRLVKSLSFLRSASYSSNRGKDAAPAEKPFGPQPAGALGSGPGEKAPGALGRASASTESDDSSSSGLARRVFSDEVGAEHATSGINRAAAAGTAAECGWVAPATALLFLCEPDADEPRRGADEAAASGHVEVQLVLPEPLRRPHGGGEDANEDGDEHGSDSDRARQTSITALTSPRGENVEVFDPMVAGSAGHPAHPVVALGQEARMDSCVGSKGPEAHGEEQVEDASGEAGGRDGTEANADAEAEAHPVPDTIPTSHHPGVCHHVEAVAMQDGTRDVDVRVGSPFEPASSPESFTALQSQALKRLLSRTQHGTEVAMGQANGWDKQKERDMEDLPPPNDSCVSTGDPNNKELEADSRLGRSQELASLGTGSQTPPPRTLFQYDNVLSSSLSSSYFGSGAQTGSSSGESSYGKAGGEDAPLVGGASSAPTGSGSSGTSASQSSGDSPFLSGDSLLSSGLLSSGILSSDLLSSHQSGSSSDSGGNDDTSRLSGNGAAKARPRRGANVEKAPERKAEGPDAAQGAGETQDDGSSSTGTPRYTVALGPFKFSYYYVRGRKKHH